MHERDQRGPKPHRHRHARAVEHAREKIPAQAVGAHPVRRARRLQETFRFQAADGVGRNPRRENAAASTRAIKSPLKAMQRLVRTVDCSEITLIRQCARMRGST